MDTMYRKKTREAEEGALALQKKSKEGHVADSYSPKVRPRETHPDVVDADQRISKNLNKLNRRLVETPTAEAKEKGEDGGIKVITKKGVKTTPIPVAMILSCALIAAVFMYMLTLFVQIEEFSHSIDTLESQIAGLKDEATQLEVQLENKYDLDEVERIATQEYGMVAASTLPKKYVSVIEEKEVWQEAETEEKTFWERIFGN